MAEAIVSSVAEGILEKLGSAVVDEVCLCWGFKDNLVELRKTVERVQAVLLDAEEKSFTNNEVKVWLAHLKQAFYEADDLLDEFSTEVSRRKLMPGLDSLGLGCTTFFELIWDQIVYFITKAHRGSDVTQRQALAHRGSDITQRQAFSESDDSLDEFSEVVDSLNELFPEALRRKRMPGLDSLDCTTFFELIWDQIVYFITKTHRVSGITQRLNKIFYSKNFQLEERSTKGAVVAIRSETHSYPPEVVVGREDDKGKIINALLSADGEDGVGYISIVGIGGLGKTTLAQLVFNDEKVKEYFEPKEWVCVSDNFDLKVIIGNILGQEKSENENLNTLAGRLRKKINGKRYLLVLDDVWSENPIEWRSLTDLLVGGSRGSRVIVTTRSKRVADMPRRILVHEVKGLCDMESWSLLKQMAFSKDQECSDDYQKIGEEILKKCCGVPLAIRAIGGLLYFKQSVDEWRAFEDKEIMKIGKEADDILPVLEISYNHLPPHLKNCFVYCRLFPKDSRIEVPKLINYWIAQGFVKVSDASQCPTDVGLEYFEELSWRSFFQEVEKDDWGNVSSCKMHDLIHDLATKLAGVECGMFVDLVGDNRVGDGRALHASFLFDPDTPWKLPEFLLKAGNLRTLLLLHEWYMSREMEETQWDVLISSFKRLRMLDLHRSNITNIPRSISNLKHLRHLDLSFNNNIKVLPDSISMLYNLLILILDYCTALEQLPGNTQKLKNLTQLSLDWCFHLTHMPQGMGQLTSLHKLTRFVVAANSFTTKHASTLKELGGLNNLRGELKIINLGYVREATEFLEANLKGKQHLQQLTLEWGEEDNFEDVEGMALEALEPHPNLKWFTVFLYKGSKIPRWLSFLHNLEELCLSSCFNCRHLPPMHQLYKLKRLRIFGLKRLEYMDEEPTTKSATGGSGESTSTTSASSFFPSLEALELGDCPNLEGWWKTTPTESRSFPCLSQLYISDSPKMTSMPLFPTLKDLIFRGGSVISLKGILNTGMAPAEECTSSSSAPWTFSLSLSLSEELESLPEDLAQNLHSLKTLIICDCYGLKTLGQALRHLTSLESLTIVNCSNLNLFEEAMHWQALRSLGSLWIEHIPTLEFFPSWFQQAMPSLQELHISNCANLKCLPEWMGQLPSLQNLIIWRCSQLSKRCCSNEGVDWPNIASIPNIKINDRVIQENGRYMLS